jgi:hypothetical protein
MTLIQVILVIAVIILLLLYLKLFRNTLLQRILFVFVFVAGIVAVIFPELTNRIANFVGVGRGADLLLYLMVIIFYFAFIVLYRKLNKIQDRQTEIIREISIQNAIKYPNEK